MSEQSKMEQEEEVRHSFFLKITHPAKKNYHTETKKNSVFITGKYIVWAVATCCIIMNCMALRKVACFEA